MERDKEENANRYYDHARSYDYQIVGRFLSTDLHRGQPEAPGSWNRYRYSGSNPLVVVDPTGLGDIYVFNLFRAGEIYPATDARVRALLRGTDIRYRTGNSDLPFALNDSRAEVFIAGHTVRTPENLAVDVLINPQAGPLADGSYAWGDVLYTGSGGEIRPGSLTLASCLSLSICGAPSSQKIPGMGIVNSPYSPRLLVYAVLLARQRSFGQNWDDAEKVAETGANNFFVQENPGQPDEKLKGGKRLPCAQVLKQVGNVTGFCPGTD